jgi:hypothetical protein
MFCNTGSLSIVEYRYKIDFLVKRFGITNVPSSKNNLFLSRMSYELAERQAFLEIIKHAKLQVNMTKY